MVSLDHHGRLSPFTNVNLAVGRHTFSIGARGELVSAGIKTADSSGAIQVFEQIYGTELHSLPHLDSDDSDTIALLVHLGLLDPETAKQTTSDADSEHFLATIKLQAFIKNRIEGAYALLRSNHSLMSDVGHAEMSGTSMASPNLTDFVADLVAREMSEMPPSREELTVLKQVLKDGIWKPFHLKPP